MAIEKREQIDSWGEEADEQSKPEELEQQVELLKKQGTSRIGPAASTVKISIRISPEMIEQLDRRAATANTSRSDILQEIIKEEFSE